METIANQGAALLSAAIALREAGRYAQAAGMVGGWLGTHAGDVRALALLVQLLLLEKKDDEAQAVLAQAQALAPGDPFVQCSQARLHLKKGRAAEALLAARAACDGAPDDPEACLVLAATLGANRQEGEATQWVERALGLRPDYAEAHANRAMLRVRSNDIAGALADAERAASLKPHMSQLWTLLAGLRRQSGDLPGALQALQKVPAQEPGNVAAWTNYATALHEVRRFDEARAAYERAWALDPNSAAVANSLGILAMIEKNWANGLRYFGRAAELAPDSPGAHHNLGNALKELKRLDEAVASYRRAIELKPDFAEAHCNLGGALQELELLEDAVASYLRAIALNPNFAKAYSNLSAAQRHLGRLDAAEDSCRRAIAIKADLPEAYVNLANVQHARRKFEEAEASCRHAIALNPDLAEAYANLGNALQDLGRPEEAQEGYRRAVALRPGFYDAQTNLLYSMALCCNVTPAQYVEEARTWEMVAFGGAAEALPDPNLFQRTPRAGRRLRIGYVSGDLREHPVSKFLEPLFLLHNRKRVEVIAYSTSAIEDGTTVRMRALADGWHSLLGLGSDQACRLVREAEIDVLIDLSGHTRHSRLDVFARRAAPVQAHYIGYFASTGLSQMDYWIGDRVLMPESDEGHFSETPWRLPRVWLSYQGSEAAPGAMWRPHGDATVMLGSFNKLNKVTPATVALWAKVLHALPEGKLLLKAGELDDESNRRWVQAAFAQLGVPEGRLVLRGRTDFASHLATYDELDIALDPIGGLGGVTTTCDALWMAVPVVTLPGDRLAQRVTASLLHGLGHPEWIAQDADDYVAKVVALARDLPLRRELRATQRERMRNSELCDGAGLADALETAYEEMFDRRFPSG
ncbi:MAG: repeat protein [Ramlibacter sp.]|nr:repeat protein [Ramlibacter sp.]